MYENAPPRRPRPGMTIHPRKVRGGVRIAWAGVGEPKTWAARRLLDAAFRSAGPEDFGEGQEYARRGQTVTVEIAGGLASAMIQGRAERPYSTTLRFRPIPEGVWTAAAESMAGEAIYTARLLAGEVPEHLDAQFAAGGASLVPTATDIDVSCSCGHSSGWCKHACCLAAIVADRVDQRPFLVFELRGHRGDGLLDALRSRTGHSGVTAVARPVYEAHVPDAPSARGEPLEECLDRFWDSGTGLRSIQIAIAPPAVTHPLLRRLGPSPFKEWRFPLVGLLATCYDVMSEANLDRDDEPEGDDEDGAERGL